MSATRNARQVHPNLLLAIYGTAALMTALDAFIVNVALRQIGHNVGQGSLNDLIWVLNAYTIIFAALLVPAGRLGDRYGKKAVFILGLVLFALSSLGAALSSDLWLIVGFRCVQAAGGAALVPTSLGLILTTIPPEQRRRAISILGQPGVGWRGGRTCGRRPTRLDLMAMDLCHQRTHRPGRGRSRSHPRPRRSPQP
jgi:MFS family permease